MVMSWQTETRPEEASSVGKAERMKGVDGGERMNGCHDSRQRRCSGVIAWSGCRSAERKRGKEGRRAGEKEGREDGDAGDATTEACHGLDARERGERESERKRERVTAVVWDKRGAPLQAGLCASLLACWLVCPPLPFCSLSTPPLPLKPQRARATWIANKGKQTQQTNCATEQGSTGQDRAKTGLDRAG